MLLKTDHEIQQGQTHLDGDDLLRWLRVKVANEIAEKHGYLFGIEKDAEFSSPHADRYRGEFVILHKEQLGQIMKTLDLIDLTSGGHYKDATNNIRRELIDM